MLEITNLCYTYPHSPEPALQEISFFANRGEVILITGSSGCGKSTLLNCLNGLNPAHYGGTLTGQIMLDGLKLNELPLWQFAHFSATVFQNPNTQFFQTSVRHELAFGPELAGLSVPDIEDKISVAAKNFGLQDFLHRDIFSLSSGEKQRVAVASAAMLSQPLVLFDEPTANLDLEGVAGFKKIISRLKAENRIILIVEHRIEYLRGIADRVLVLDKGQLAECGEPQILDSQDLRSRYGLRCWNTSLEAVKEPLLTAKTSLIADDISYCIKKRKILDNLSFSLFKGEITALAGCNGAGKTTLARALAGLLKGAKGVIQSGNQSFKIGGYNGLTGYVSQQADQQLFTDSVEEEISLGLSSSSSSSRDQLLNDFDLTNLKKRHPHSLSGGEKQRTALAAGIALYPSILILDEPTSGMDGKRLNQLANQLCCLASQDIAVLVITHDPELIAKCCNRILWLENGKIERELKLHELEAMLHATNS